MISGAHPIQFTVFTPTYNRAHTLHRVFESLCAQTFSDFEWLVIDDGSTDSTQSEVAQMQKRARFSMRVVTQANQGLVIAFNRAVREAKGFLFLKLDSDDACKSHALERFHHHWQSIPPASRDGFSGVTGLCEDQKGRIIGDKFPEDIFDSNTLRNRYVYRIKGEKWGCVRTDVLRKFPYPEVRRIAQSVVWHRIARLYQTRYVNEVLRVYHIDEIDSSLSREATRQIVCPEGRALRQLEMLNTEFDYFRYAPSAFIVSFVHYGRFSILARATLGRTIGDLKGPGRKLAMAVLMPVAYAMAAMDRVRGRVQR